MTKISFKPLARIDLEEIWSYTFKKWSLEQADYYVVEIHKGIENLSINPSIAKTVQYNNNEYLKHKINLHYAFCRIENNELIVVRLLHERMDFLRHL